MRSKVLKSIVVGIAGLSGFVLATPAVAQAACDRATLQDIADRYVKAQAEGSLFQLPVGEWVDYRENLTMSSSATGVLSKPAKFDWATQLLDTQQCQVFVDGVITSPSEYVLATVVNNGFFGVNQVSTVIRAAPAAAAIEAGKAEQWGELPEANRMNRAALIAAANAHLDGMPDPLADRSFVVDEAKGAVGVFGRVGGSTGPAASYTFRIENGEIRHVRGGVSKQ